MNKEDLIKHIAEYLEKGLPDNLVYDFPFITTLTGVKEVYKSRGTLEVVREDFNIEITFVGMFK